MHLHRFFKRKQQQDDISKFSYFRVGVSLGASWSWGVSMIATMAFMHTMGILPALVWVAGNILAMPLFGYVKTKIKNFSEWINFIPLILFSLFIAAMAVIMNMQALLIGLGGGHDVASFHFLDSSYSIPAIIALSLAILVFIYRYGLRGDVLSDFGYYSIQLLAAISLAVSSMLVSGFSVNPDLTLATELGLNWVFPLGLLGIITGVFTDPMMWQRFEQKENQIRLGLWGGFWFGIYMLFVVLTGLFFQPTLLLGTLLLIVIFSLAVSTIGSATTATQFMTKKLGIGKTPGLIVVFATILTWPKLMDLGMANIWNIYAGYRWKIVTAMILISFVGQYLLRQETREKVLNLMERIKLLHSNE